MSTICKFRCVSKTEDADGFELIFTAVTGGSEENKKIFKYTPDGKLVMRVVNKDAAEQFTPGETYFLTISKSDA